MCAPRMSDYITSYDLPLLYSAKFKPGISDTILWQRDTHGVNWQAVADGGEYIMFIEHDNNYMRQPERTMSRQEFKERFGV